MESIYKKVMRRLLVNTINVLNELSEKPRLHIVKDLMEALAAESETLTIDSEIADIEQAVLGRRGFAMKMNHEFTVPTKIKSTGDGLSQVRAAKKTTKIEKASEILSFKEFRFDNDVTVTPPDYHSHNESQLNEPKDTIETMACDAEIIKRIQDLGYMQHKTALTKFRQNKTDATNLSRVLPLEHMWLKLFFVSAGTSECYHASITVGKEHYINKKNFLNLSNAVDSSKIFARTKSDSEETITKKLEEDYPGIILNKDTYILDEIIGTPDAVIKNKEGKVTRVFEFKGKEDISKPIWRKLSVERTQLFLQMIATGCSHGTLVYHTVPTVENTTAEIHWKQDYDLSSPALSKHPDWVIRAKANLASFWDVVEDIVNANQGAFNQA